MWVNCNWFIYKGLKNKDKNFQKKLKKTIRLNYSCKNGKPMGANNFSWSLNLDLKLNKN